MPEVANRDSGAISADHGGSPRTRDPRESQAGRYWAYDIVLTEEHSEATFRVNDFTRVEVSAQRQAKMFLQPVPQAGGPQTGVAGNGLPPPPARPAKAGQAANHKHTASDETTRIGRQAEPA